jgi:heavy metal sensor kinase
MSFIEPKIRIRLTLWYVSIFGAVLVAFICVASILHYLHLIDQLYYAEVQDMETVEGLLDFGPDGQLHLRDDYLSPQHRLLLDRMLQVLNPDGTVLFRNSKLGENMLGGSLTADEGRSDYFRHYLRLADGTHVLAISHVRAVQGRTVLIRVGYSTEPIRKQSIQLFGLLMLMMPFALFAAGFAGARVAGKALDPLETMAQLTEHITALRLNERIPVKNPDDELGHMARVLNNLLGRLEASFQKLQRFTSDVSHELRTPLASIRSVGEVGLQADQSPEEYRDIIGSMLEEVARLTTMVDTLLTIAHADSGVIKLMPSSFSIIAMVQECVAIVRVLAEEKKQSISVTGADLGEMTADRSFLRMAVVNLLDNAVKYSPYDSSICVRLHLASSSSVKERTVEIEIRDQGPGIPEADRERIFDRFVRLDDARGHETGGAGLGLSIAKWAVEAHGGKINVATAIGGGANFSITLPVRHHS